MEDLVDNADDIETNYHDSESEEKIKRADKEDVKTGGIFFDFLWKDFPCLDE